MMLIDKMLYWIKERESVRLNKEAGEKKPWSKDTIFQDYRFCNVDREHDKVTTWIRKNWREPYINHPNMHFAMAVARLFNWPPTLEVIGFPEKLDFDWFVETEKKLFDYREKGNKVWTGVYLVSTNGVKMDKIRYVLNRVLYAFWKEGRSPNPSETLQSYFMHISSFNGLGNFMSGQVIADLKHTPMLSEASDWWSWAVLGPGSLRGLNRVYGRSIHTPIKPDQALKEIQYLQGEVERNLDLRLCCQNIQNCLCETDKYLRVLNGEGKPRNGYPGRG